MTESFSKLLKNKKLENEKICKTVQYSRAHWWPIAGAWYFQFRTLLLDHLASSTVRVVPIYFDQKRHAYRLSEAQLYSNTPADFDFQVQRLAKALTPKQLIAELKRCDLVFPAIHGAFGEDGEIQTLLEKHGIPFVGSVRQRANSALISMRHRTPSRVMAFLPCPVRSSRSTTTTMRRSCATSLRAINRNG